ncbi:hypothetical protein NRIC_11580 [Enterococcus florum]|uniref:Uncharacterized protein n=1 Tax=Enterococcus florum TaxID=2480627 RepID=A0A4P5P5W3_9ENTE|nr:hypothetical protein NRIC_11580 [Enterococcus florum]
MAFTRTRIFERFAPHTQPEELSFYCATSLISTHKMTSYLKADGSLLYIAEYIYGVPASTWSKNDFLLACSHLQKSNIELYFKFGDNEYQRLSFE